MEVPDAAALCTAHIDRESDKPPHEEAVVADLRLNFGGIPGDQRRARLIDGLRVAVYEREGETSENPQLGASRMGQVGCAIVVMDRGGTRQPVCRDAALDWAHRSGSRARRRPLWWGAKSVKRRAPAAQEGAAA